MRWAVLDPDVFVSALINPSGTPAKLAAAAAAGEFEPIVSPALLAELDRVLRRGKFRRHFDLDTAGEYVARLRRTATEVADPESSLPLRSFDPEDDYLIALAYSQNAIVVSGDSELLEIVTRDPASLAHGPVTIW